MTPLRRLARITAGAALAVVLAVTTSQILTDDGLAWNWLYVSLAVAVLAAIYSEVLAGGTAPPPRRGSRGVYLRQLRASVRNMETVGVATQGEYVLRMRQVYVDVSLVPKPTQDTAHEPYVGTVAPPPGERRTLTSFLDGDGSRVLAVIGGPGSGKTTLVRDTALRLCRRRGPLPVLMYLREHAPAILADDPPGLAALAASVGWLDGRVPAEWVERRLDRGGCVVLLDGLDEVADESDRSRVVAWVRRQMDRHPHNTYVLTSRPHGYLSNPLPNADVLQVRRFTGEQISRFLHGWYHAIECRATGSDGPQVRADATRKADDLLERLRARPALYDLAANPLLLTMIANVHRYRDQLPGSRAALYAEMCDVLLHRRAEARDLRDGTGLRGPQKERVVRHLALAMMKEGVRSMPAREACRAVRRPLRQVSREVTPEAFLDVTRKSGLLVEHENGAYSFAHLTLQEYLAAARIGEQGADLLTGCVDDPWWRETTLLWSADADATPVIRACLDSGSVRALALAFDCAEEAAEVDPDVRARLEEILLVHDETTDAERRRLVNGVMAARALREVVWLSEDRAMCARPVSRDLYAAFAREERAAGLHTPDPGTGQDPAAGMWANDAERFVAWLNGLFDDGTGYRLPTPQELGDPAAGLVADLTERTAWAQGGNGILLHWAGDRPPYPLDPMWQHTYPRRDVSLLETYLRAAAMTVRQAEGLARTARTFHAALEGGGEAPGMLLLYERERARLTAGARERYNGPSGREAMSLVATLDEAQPLELTTLVRLTGVAVPLFTVLKNVPPYTGTPDLPDLAAAPYAGGHLRDDLLAPLAMVLVEGSEMLDVAPAYRLNLAFDLALTLHHEPEGPAAMNAYRVLLDLWEPSVPRTKPGAALQDLERFLGGVLGRLWLPGARVPDNPLAYLEEMALLTDGHLAAPHHDVAPSSLIREALRLVTPILTRQAPFRRAPMAAARVSLLAAVALLNRTGAPQLATKVEYAYRSLIHLQNQEDGVPGSEPGQLLLLMPT